ncbi:allophanate hydrolase subunit 1 [Epibacterium ulvae]|uniref:5-oxoprolinase subunit B family protein n=1 Tax=Epibacterium ulvae TaxID=1156985 RepID=UPI001BFC4956|nr:allophanate hydrolase subunit 1 [Epibacterium ulvae]MBT8153655.1 allophanate hydrolase subunit 1 [Epibacterium ulvae]
MKAIQRAAFPHIRTVGLFGLIVSFADRLSEPHNRAALAFREAVTRAAIDGVAETSTSLASVFVRFDPDVVSHAELTEALQTLLATQDWSDASLPPGRRLWKVPTVYGTDRGPQLAEAADLAGMSEEGAIEALGTSRVRVLTIGFAPGQPYLGPLAAEWNIPRQTELTPKVPQGALVLAVSQFVLFADASPTGWRHVGQTGFRTYRPEADEPFALRAGDEMVFFPVTKSEYLRILDKDPELGGACMENIDL